jgi:hypothetical protein
MSVDMILVVIRLLSIRAVFSRARGKFTGAVYPEHITWHSRMMDVNEGCSYTFPNPDRRSLVNLRASVSDNLKVVRFSC